MPINLTIRDVPYALMEKLLARAASHDRSLQEELLSVLEEAVGGESLSLEEVAREVAKLNLSTPDEATAMIRSLRDGRNYS